MKFLTLSLLLVLVLSFGCVGSQPVVKASPVTHMDVIEFETPAPKNPCLDQDVWVYLRHKDKWDPTCTVIVYIPKHSLEGMAEIAQLKTPKL